MAQTITDAGAEAILNAFFKGSTAPTAFTLRLFTDNATLAEDDVVTDRTAANGGGYADATLTVANATVSVTPASPAGIAQVAWPEEVFTFTGALTGNPTIYGYMIFDSNNVLLTQELFTDAGSSAFTPANNGDHADITPVIQLGGGTVA